MALPRALRATVLTAAVTAAVTAAAVGSPSYAALLTTHGPSHAAVHAAHQTGAKPVQLTVVETTVAARSVVKVTGSFAGKVKRSVVLQRAVPGSWATMATKATKRTGAFAVRITMPAKTGKVRIRALAPAAVIGGKRYPAVASKTLTLTVLDRSDPALPGGPGSTEDPYDTDQPFQVGPWGFSFGATDTDHWPEVQASGSDATDAPLPGWHYVTVPVTFVNHTSQPATPYYETYVEFLGNDHQTYDDSSGDQWCGEIPGGIVEVEDIAPGASVTGLVCAAVPVGAISGGQWRASVDGEDGKELEAYVAVP